MNTITEFSIAAVVIAALLGAAFQINRPQAGPLEPAVHGSVAAQGAAPTDKQ